MDGYLVRNVMMDERKKRWPVFLFYHNSGYQKEDDKMSISHGMKSTKDKIDKDTLCHSIFFPLEFLDTKDEN